MARITRTPKTTLATEVVARQDAAMPTAAYTQWTDVDLIQASPWQPRVQFDEGELQALAADIEQHGILQRPLARLEFAVPQLAFGERRTRAARLAVIAPGAELLNVRDHNGVRQIQLDIAEISDDRMSRIAISENSARADINPIELARAYSRRVQEFGVTQSAIAREAGKSEGEISHVIRLLELPEDVQQMVIDGRISQSHARALVQYRQFPKFVSWYAGIIEFHNYPVKDIERGIRIDSWQDQDAARKLGLCVRLNHINKKFTDKHPSTVFPACTRTGYGEAWYCLDTEAHDAWELREREAEKRKLSAATARAIAAGSGGGGPVKMSDLQYGTYERLSGQRNQCPGCTEECPCRVQAVGYAGELEPICIDPKRHKQLKNAATRAANKERREKVRAARVTVERIIDAMPGRLRERELAVILLPILDQKQMKHLEPIVARLRIPLDNAYFHSNLYSQRGKRLGMLAKLSESQLIQLAFEVLMSDHLNAWEQGASDGSLVEWVIDPRADKFRNYRPQPSLLDEEELPCAGCGETVSAPYDLHSWEPMPDGSRRNAAGVIITANDDCYCAECGAEKLALPLASAEVEAESEPAADIESGAEVPTRCPRCGGDRQICVACGEAPMFCECEGHNYGQCTACGQTSLYVSNDPEAEPPAPVTVRACRVCGCTDADCRQCIAKAGHPCSWVDGDLCSACAESDAAKVWTQGDAITWADARNKWHQGTFQRALPGGRAEVRETSPGKAVITVDIDALWTNAPEQQ